MTNYIPSPVKLPPRHFIFHSTIPFSNGKLLKRKDVQKCILLLRHSLFRSLFLHSFFRFETVAKRQFPKLFPLIEFAPGSLSACIGTRRSRNSGMIGGGMHRSVDRLGREIRRSLKIHGIWRGGEERVRRERKDFPERG